jgi:predicted CoA-binding protein
MKRIAVVGLSDSPIRPSYGVSQYMLGCGYDIVPVNPKCAEVLGRKGYCSLTEVPPPLELVNVFRRSEYCEDVVRDAIAAGAKGVWLQLGIRNDRAAQLAREAGIDFVQDRCIMIEFARHGSSGRGFVSRT